MKVLLTDTYLGEPSLERRLLADHGIELMVAPRNHPETLMRYEVDGMLNCAARIPARVIEHSPRLKVIARYGIGVDNIDVEAASRQGVMVCNVPDYCIEEVAIHALAMILDCSRHITWYHESLRRGNWEWKVPPVPRRLTGQVLGVVGMGRIGSTVCRKAQSLGLRILGYDPLVTPEEAARFGASWIPFEQVLAEADYLTLHVPLQPETENLIDAQALSRMKPTAYLINTCRGRVVDIAALLTALEDGALAGAALDVYPEEPLPIDSPLRAHPRVILTPHVAWYSAEALEEVRRKAVGFVLATLRGDKPASLVNAEAFNR